MSTNIEYTANDMTTFPKFIDLNSNEGLQNLRKLNAQIHAQNKLKDTLQEMFPELKFKSKL